MKIPILEISESNMAGFEWTVTFFINKTKSRGLTLSCRHSRAEEGGTPRVPAVKNLTSGNQVYDALTAILDDMGDSIENHDTDEIAREIKAVDKKMASEFRRAAQEGASEQGMDDD